QLQKSAGKGKGEWVLKLHLYEYLHDEGLQFSIDPYSPLGKADLLSQDLIADQSDREKLIADGKLVKDTRKGKTAIIFGFHQVYKYTLDYNDPFGYLIVFNATDKVMNIAGDGIEQSVQYVEEGGRRVYVIVIDIHPDPVQASKRGRMTQDI